jgi:hypothetical protein
MTESIWHSAWYSDDKLSRLKVVSSQELEDSEWETQPDSGHYLILPFPTYEELDWAMATKIFSQFEPEGLELDEDDELPLRQLEFRPKLRYLSQRCFGWLLPKDHFKTFHDLMAEVQK